ncbi:RteC domain-containing protein [Chryseobacterium gotjawalense]|uniref:RteC domain-containing protein n=1 Tax=Chryseobacterium gotjawalense TaxID=3042315 RepID=A0ABY8REL7_9FLAO|nr:RteC domain-containing protein [Chryseobacterium sp. wdc7]WHF51459.1 RteC domain-containing protein [Chryseobacterium sp. wdc7]
MMKFIINLENELESKILLLNLEQDRPLKRAEAAILEINIALKKLKSFVLRYRFTSESEEIDFFKNRKPLVLSKLIYYNDIFRIETRKPSGGEKMIRKYYQTELSKLKGFFEENVDFYGYYRTNSTYLDHKYFIRKKLDIRLSLDSFVFETDSRFSTSHDYKVAKIMANDLLEVYLNDELIKLNRQSEEHYSILTPKTKLVWSDNKTALIEIIYALHYKGSFNNGNADIKEISAYFEAIFSIELGDVYRTYLEIKNRSARTKFLTGLEELLNRKMEDRDA